MFAMHLRDGFFYIFTLGFDPELILGVLPPKKTQYKLYAYTVIRSQKTGNQLLKVKM
jgi:hypothetical protein